MTNVLKGIGASDGIAIAKVYRLIEPNIEIVETKIADANAEIEKFKAAIAKSEGELRELKEKVAASQGEEESLIFEAHITMLNDPEINQGVIDKINADSVNAEFALKTVSDMFIMMFKSMDNEYMRERAADIRDITKRVNCHLLGLVLPNPSLIKEEVIVIAHDLTPSDTAQLNKEFVKGFATNIGGRTSHSAIMARSLEIPAVVGTGSATELKDGDIIALDGFEGVVHLNPTEEMIESLNKKQADFEAQKAEWAQLLNEKTVSADGHHVELVANIGSPNDVEGVMNNGGEGVGLYRTEFLYMDTPTMPTEEDQFKAYKTVLENMGGKPVVVRTLDIGGDKKLPYLELPEEENPFLGVRAVRLCLNEQEIFRTQLRALIRASAFGNLKIMFPMIATLGEFRAAKAIYEEEKAKLISDGHEVSDSIELGIMVEIPAAAVLADQFAKEVDFFSIGTNDLIQYTMAADRMNEQVSYLYQPYNPAILRLIKMTIDASHREGKWTGMCGEMAGETLAAPILLGLGLDEFSMSATSVLKTRSILKKINKSDAEVLANKALECDTADQVVELVENFIAELSAVNS